MPGEEKAFGFPKPGYLIATENGQAENHGGRLVAGTIARGGSSVEPAGFQGRESLGIGRDRQGPAGPRGTPGRSRARKKIRTNLIFFLQSRQNAL